MKRIVFLLVFVAFFGNLSCEKPKGTRDNAPTPLPPPVISTARILPEAPNRDNEISVLIEGQDPSGQAFTYDCQWIKNGEEISGENKSVLSPGNFRKGDLIQVRVTPKNQKTRGDAFLAGPVKILNSPPGIQEVWIETKTAHAGDILRAHVKSLDKDGDFVYLIYQWEKNGEVLSDEKDETLSPGRFKKGDSITVIVTPDDREVLGKPKKSDPVVIANSPPMIVSSPPTSVQGTVYLYQVKATDPDGDPVTFRLKSGPKGMEIDPKTGLIRWEIRKENQGTHTVEIEASDHEGARSLQQYMLSIEVR